ncbi:hypothetical protein ACK6D9_17725 [Hoeflea sp. Naph1]|uniref:hypothetical protein n=1 Tax=Hoeflea sp. Naph1 TaxID=3388653 RepID=UPI00398FF98C
MEHIAAFMLLIACSNDLQTCTEQPAPTVAYESMQQCELELRPALQIANGKYGKTMGKCVEIDPALFYEDAEIVWDVTAQGEIEVAIELINPQIDLNAMARSDHADETTRVN